jgi:hypothetical protein
MPTTLTLDAGLDFDRVLPGERRRPAHTARSARDRRPAGDPAVARTPVPPHPRGRLTLDDVIVGAWEGLLAAHQVTCPICSGAMEPRHGSGPRPVGGRCRDCRTTLG